ncbi:hypothetical protein FH712_18055 [Marinobacter nauticus]|uniref:hypothetical protein n=1 Tax=Marinobacter nauticus TaxID=2743 RepID=UPI00112F96B7|nr:hypothetical protein [Marinobacter nauticus]TPW22175.1 hypothetical protein FH712_18055 [Marinobacter nauticus]
MEDSKIIKNIDFKTVISFATATAFIISALDLLFYWNAFNINIFHHLTPSDILSRSIPPISYTAVSLIGVLLIEIHTGGFRKQLKQEKKTSENSENIVNFGFVIFPTTAAGMGIYLQHFSTSNLYLVAYSYMAVLIIVHMAIITKTNKVIEERTGIPFPIFLIVICIIATVFSKSMYKAVQVIDGKEYIEATVFVKEIKEPIKQSYIGETNNTLFLFEKNKRTVIELRKDQILKIEKKKIG